MYIYLLISPFHIVKTEKLWRWVWSTVVRRPSEVYDTYRPTKLIAPKTINRSRELVGAHQNLNGSRDLTTPLSGMVCLPWATTCYSLPIYQIRSLHL